jgi:ParB family chromosome partitioning protein
LGIEPHPKNPRRELGDLNGLAESIKAKGILQPLTVVMRQEDEPGCMTCGLYLNVVGKCSKGYDETEKAPCPKWEHNGKYTAVIGHRRLAAAKKAGLPEVPCIIAEMEEREQIETMLLENMQRSDLTLYEESKGIEQLTMFGLEAEDIAERVGLSKQTVEKRLKLAKLPDKEFREAVKRQVTIEDMLKLDNIQDAEVRAVVLDKLGTSNGNYAYENAIRQQIADGYKAELETWLEEHAKRISLEEAENGYKQIFSLYFEKDFKKRLPEGWEDETLYWSEYRYSSSVYSVYRVCTADETNAEVEQEHRAALNAELNEVADTCSKLRQTFVKAYNGENENALLDLVIADYKDSNYSYFDKSELSKVKGKGKNRKQLLLAVWYARNLKSGGKAHYGYGYNSSAGENQQKMYANLAKLGYEISDAEQSYIDGTHELYTKFNNN